VAASNSINIVGFVADDFEIKENAQSSISAKIPIHTEHTCQVNNSIYNEIHWCMVFGDLALQAKESMKKGHLVQIQGAMHYHIYNDRSGGSKRISQIIVEQYQILSKKKRRI
jgi:single-stranded DNA-binding protein